MIDDDNKKENQVIEYHLICKYNGVHITVVSLLPKLREQIQKKN